MSTPEEVREALRRVESALTGFGGGDACHYGATGGCGDKSCGGCQSALGLLDTLESALTPPPVEDADLEAVLQRLEADSCSVFPHPEDEDHCSECRADRENQEAARTLRSQVAAKDRSLAAHIENTAQMGEENQALRRQLAAAENRGFRAAAEWLADNGYALPGPTHPAHHQTSIAALRAEADRREGPPESVWPSRPAIRPRVRKVRTSTSCRTGASVIKSSGATQRPSRSSTSP